MFYNKVAFEAGGANPARTFSYYIGAGAYNQNYRYYDQYNGASLQQNYGPPITPCAGAAPGANVGCTNGAVDYTNGGTLPAYVLGPYMYAPSGVPVQAAVQDRDTIANFHFGLPRKDGNKDDIQLLFDNNFINNPAYDSTNDLGGSAFANNSGLGVPAYYDTYTFTGAPTGTLLPVGYAGGGTSPYLFPQSPNGRGYGLANCGPTTLGATNGCIDPDRRDAFNNNQSVLKLQYQHNFGTSAFLRVYGYSYYSNWLQTGPQTNFGDYVGYVPADYELSSHTRGLSVNFSDQLNSQHLLSVQGSYTTASTLRDNNTQDVAGAYNSARLNGRTVVGLLVDSSNPTNGICYTFAGVPTPCFNAAGSDLNRGATHPNGIGAQPGFFNLLQAANGTVTPASGTCGAGACQYLVVENGLHATYNTVSPKFSAFSITDQWKPTDRLNINLGLRFDRFEFDGSDTTGTAARTFFYNAFNNQFPTLAQVNTSGQVEAYNVIQPRLGMTYTVNPTTVLRASYGRYAQAPNSAFEQYNFLQQDAPVGLANFVRFGVGNTPAHAIRPEVSNNYDFSYEHQFKGDTSIKFTPFLRKTQDQIQQFFLDQKTNFVSGLNVGRQTSEGLELEVDKGDFSRNGLAARLSFTYTNSYINYSRLANGLSVIDPFNASIIRVQRLHQSGRRRCLLYDGNRERYGDRNARRCGSRLRAGYDREPVLQRSASGAAGRQRQLPDVRHLPGRYRRGRLQLVRRTVRRDADRAVQARSAVDHAGAPVLRRVTLRRSDLDRRHLPELLWRRARWFDRRRSALRLRRARWCPVRRHAVLRQGRCRRELQRSHPQPGRRKRPSLSGGSEPVHEALRRCRRLRFALADPAAHAGHLRREQTDHARRQLREHHQPLLRRDEGAVRGQPRVQLHRHVRCGLRPVTARGRPVQSRQCDPADFGEPVSADVPRLSVQHVLRGSDQTLSLGVS